MIRRVMLLLLLCVTSLSAQEDSPWVKVELSAKTMCSDGSEFFIRTRQGSSDNLMIYFAGGGAAWNAEAAAQPISLTNFSGFYFARIWEIVFNFLGGIWDTQNENNPFRDWTMVYIPYCTGDLHFGNTAITYDRDNGKSFTIFHNGRQNVLESLDWVFAHFDQPDKLVISGESAGAWGSVVWTPYIAEQYPDSEIYHIGDGSYIPSPQWEHIVNEVWQADFEANFGYNVGDEIVTSAYQHPAPNVTYLHINTLYDGVIIRFAAAINEIDDEAAYRETWSQGVRETMEQLAAAQPNYFYFLTDYGLDPNTNTTPHTSLSSDLFYQIEQDGVHLYDWIDSIINDGE